MVAIVDNVDFGTYGVICLNIIFSAVCRNFLFVNDMLYSVIGNRKPKDLKIVLRLGELGY